MYDVTLTKNTNMIYGNEKQISVFGKYFDVQSSNGLVVHLRLSNMGAV